MRYERYIELMQQLITMTDPDDEEEVLCAKNILKNLLELTRRSKKATPQTLQAMLIGYAEFSRILQMKEDFAGVPGDIAGNLAKRKRLTTVIRPGC